MTYATGRRFLDADSHLMELPDFLRDGADPAVRDRLPTIQYGSGGWLQGQLEKLQARGGHPAEHVEELRSLGDRLLGGPKGYEALGAFDTGERSLALDQLGFERQLVFSTFSAGTAFDPTLPDDLGYRTCRAHNRSMAEFCAGDDRLVGVAAVALDQPDRAVEELEFALGLGLGAVWVPHRHCGGRSPGHDDLDPFWARLQEAGVPFVLHVGGAPLQIPAPWMNTGREVPTDWLGGGENVRAKDMVGLHQGAELFVGTMVLDGVLERFPRLKGGVIELGAAWVPAMVRRLDQVAGIWAKSEPELRDLSRPPSEQIAQQLGFTPYPFEDVGAMVRESDDRLYLFSSDYPHAEGGRDPLGRFRRSLEGASDETQDRFYAGNLAELLGV
jgi:uncharacterized protein